VKGKVKSSKFGGGKIIQQLQIFEKVFLSKMSVKLFKTLLKANFLPRAGKTQA